VMKKFIFLISLLLTLYSNAQDFSKKELARIRPVIERSSSTIRNFDKSALISIEKTGSNADGFLESSFFRCGFQVVSNKVAKEAIELTNTLNRVRDTLSVFKSIEYKSVYVVSVSANSDYAITSFTARIIDLANEGKLVGVFTYSAGFMGRPIEDVSNAFVYTLLRATNPNVK
jgi:hypothetical protein